MFKSGYLPDYGLHTGAIKVINENDSLIS